MGSNGSEGVVGSYMGQNGVILPDALRHAYRVFC
jgi:hypothetical protein